MRVTLTEEEETRSSELILLSKGNKTKKLKILTYVSITQLVWMTGRSEIRSVDDPEANRKKATTQIITEQQLVT